MVTPKKIVVYAFLITLVGGVFGYISDKGYFCSTFICEDVFDYSGQFLFFFSLGIIISSSILIFLSRTIFLSWWKFARVYIPISAILTLLSGSGRGGGYISLTTDYESTAWFTAGLFVVISLILIITKSFSLRGK